MEMVCPVCRKWTDIPEREAIADTRCRCQECWAPFRLVSVRPLRLMAEAQTQVVAERPRGGLDAEGDEYA